MESGRFRKSSFASQNDQCWHKHITWNQSRLLALNIGCVAFKKVKTDEDHPVKKQPVYLKLSVVQFFRENYVANTLRKNLAIIIIFNCGWLYAQHNYKSPYRAGLKLGYSFHTLTGDLTESRHGQDFIGGFWFQLKMNKKWTIQTELLLLDKGIGGGPGGKSPNRVSSHQVRLHYFEIPVLFQYHKKMMYFEFGPALGYLINFSEHLNGNLSPDLVNEHPFIRRELSFNVGIGCNLNDKWALGVRLSHSLLPVRGAVPLVSKESYNRLLALSVTRQLKKKKASDPQE